MGAVAERGGAVWRAAALPLLAGFVFACASGPAGPVGTASLPPVPAGLEDIEGKILERVKAARS